MNVTNSKLDIVNKDELINNLKDHKEKNESEILELKNIIENKYINKINKQKIKLKKLNID